MKKDQFFYWGNKWRSLVNAARRIARRAANVLVHLCVKYAGRKFPKEEYTMNFPKKRFARIVLK